MVKVYDGYDYEKWCAGYLKKHGFKKIEVTQASNDQGIDILATYKGLTYGIQCKYYSSPVGNQSVQQAYSGAAYYGCDKAMVITNQIFTRSAKQLAEELDVILYPQCDPTSIPFFQRFFKWLRLFELLIGIGFFIAITSSHIDSSRLDLSLYSIFIILASCFGLFSNGKLSFLFLSWILEISSIGMLISIVNIHSIGLLWICFHILILLGLTIQILIKQYNHKLENRILSLEEAQAVHQEELFTLAQELQELIESECHCHCDIKKYLEEDCLVVQYHCDCNVSDELATAQYSINQYFTYKQRNIQIQLIDLGRRNIEVRVSQLV